ncbi:PaaI family thioesterase [Bacillus sp. PS06]|uniref:PaaI family thioesterase n=1 Tax=Bacillus sp. PS06 TaxID=2764176 RepID=UPI00177EBC52|nr:PaaI family thioesterase [Bacillus sp. PS06]MBD8067929.1 PaaI family thioesterase [Bacillus sp. PS06]
MNKDRVRTIVDEALETHEQEFGKYFLAKFYQLDISYAEETETCVVQFPVEDYMYNPQGFLHGGVIAFALDVSMGHLCKRFLGTAVTLEMKTQYLRSVSKGIVKCQASFIKKGKSIVAIESSMSNEDGKLLAIANATWYRID